MNCRHVVLSVQLQLLTLKTVSILEHSFRPLGNQVSLSFKARKIRLPPSVLLSARVADTTRPSYLGMVFHLWALSHRGSPGQVFRPSVHYSSRP